MDWINYPKLWLAKFVIAEELIGEWLIHFLNNLHANIKQLFTFDRI